MKFTFGIITSPGSDQNLQEIIDSIQNENIPEYEIIIIGGNTTYNDGILKIIPFDETVKNKWITKKKNIITTHAQYENIVYLHDYIKLNDGWYDGFLKFGNNFTTCMTKIINTDGSRYRDWCLYKLDVDPLNIPDPQLLLPYEFKNLSHLMYISGGYWVAKKHISEKYPQNESLCWGESEDIDWSLRCRNDKFYMNEYSSVQLLKWKDPIFKYPTQNTIDKLRSLNNMYE